MLTFVLSLLSVQQANIQQPQNQHPLIAFIGVNPCSPGLKVHLVNEIQSLYLADSIQNNHFVNHDNFLNLLMKEYKDRGLNIQDVCDSFVGNAHTATRVAISNLYDQF
jgi:hypothetical protein